MLSRNTKIKLLSDIKNLLDTYIYIYEQQATTSNEKHNLNRLITCLITINEIIDDLQN